MMLLVVFGIELVVMLALPYLTPQSMNPLIRALLDAGLLTVVCAPVLWWLIVGPLRRIAAQEIARSETIVANAGEGILTIDRSGTITSANRAAKKLFELPVEEIIGVEIRSLIPELTFDNITQGGELTLEGLRPNRESFPLMVSISQSPSKSDVDTIAIVRDLTEHQRLQEERVQAAREREALKGQQMATLAQLATGVAHEIRNPLTSIKMLIQINRDRFAEQGLPTEDLDLVEQEIYRMERSVNGLLEYGRPEQGEFRDFSLDEVLQKTLRLIRGRCEEAGVTIQTDFSEPPATLYGDPVQLQQLLLNLCLNALDAMQDGGKLSLESTVSEGEIHLQVSDSGSGIAPEIIDKLFSPFVTSKPNGIGLGLGICRRIAEAHHGSLTGRNLAEGGACFELILPDAEHSELREQD
ncbi:MAG: PAS domain-containing protein [Planctomycetaceae bacterium]|nr:PAS domain-containing protein [Planctomycetaceae bacterium]